MQKGTWASAMDGIICVVALSMCLYQLVATQVLIFGPWAHQNIHLGFALTLVFLYALRNAGSRAFAFWAIVLILLSLIACGYIQFFNDELDARKGIINQTDVVIGIILVFLTFEATRQVYGKTLPILCLVFIAYTFLGQYLPDPLWHFPISLDAVISKYDMGFDGMFGMVLGLSANYIFLFVLFGSLLQVSGATRFFMEVSKLISRRLSSATGMTAVTSSAMVGSVTGISGVNVVITGQFTIPAMIKAGFRPEQAGAIEAAASTGSSLVPPIMGMVAFVMAQYTGVPYIKICVQALIPAFLYYGCLCLYTHLTAGKLGIKRGVPEEVDYQALLASAPPFLIPLGVIIYILLQGYSPMYAAFYSVVTLVVVSMFRRETRIGWRQWLKGFVEGARLGASIAIISGIIGVLLASINITGLGIKFPGMIEELCGGSLYPALLLVAAAALVLGCAVPPFAVYVLVAVLNAPVLMKLGNLSVLQAHWFILLFCVFALVTPPLGLSVVVAATLAKTNYLKTSLEAVKAAVISFLLPFLVIFAPVVILQRGEPVLMTLNLTAALTIMLILQAAIVGFVRRPLRVLERCGLGLASILLVIYIVTESYLLFGVGMGLSVLLMASQWLGWRKRIQDINTVHSDASA